MRTLSRVSIAASNTMVSAIATRRFLIDELLPEVAKTWKFSNNPDDRCLAGASSGGICAFNAAWERPDAFRRVISTIGTFVALRGADAFPGLIRKTENKPLRIFLAGRQQRSGHLRRKLVARESGDVVRTAVFRLRREPRLGRRWPQFQTQRSHHCRKPCAGRGADIRNHSKSAKAKERRTDLVIEDEDWQLVSSGHKFTEGPAVNDAGELYFTDIPNNRIHKVSVDGRVTVFAEDSGAANGLMFGPDGLLYACRHADGQIVRYSADGKHPRRCRGRHQRQ